MRLLRVLSLILCFSLLFSLGTMAKTVTVDEDISDVDEPIECDAVDLSVGKDLQISAKSAILMEPHTGEILYDKNSSEKSAPASITKIMSLLLVMEAIERKELSLNEVVTASEYACSMGGSQIWLEEGETMTVDELLKATAIASANDATVALGEKISGSEECFVALMNKRAKELSMNSTTFKNCTGLDTDGHITTAYDVAIMSAELIKHSLIKNYSTVWMDSLRNGESELVNTNKLVRFYEGATGLKTGTTSKAGSCLSATAKRNNTELVAVVMGASTSKDRFSDAKKLLDFGFSNYETQEISSATKPKELTVSVENGDKKTLLGVAKGSVTVLLSKGESGKITQKVNLKESYTAPIKKGDVLGSVDIYCKEEQVGKIDITASENAEKLKFSTVLMWIFKDLFVL